jgi:alcohol-forming fatty acyl-CoA reductase
MIYHFAATINFNEKFKQAIFLNVRSVREILNLASECKNLKLFCHLSTAYCCLDEEILDEKVYEASMRPDLVIKMAEFHETDELENIFKNLEPKLSSNSYEFTKTLAESLIAEFQNDFKVPTFICRPAIVTPTEENPISGFNQGLVGPNGMFALTTLGLVTNLNFSPKSYVSIIPADHVVNNLFLFTFHFLNA